MSNPKNSKDALEFIHTLDSLAIKKQKEEIERLQAEVERLNAIVGADAIDREYGMCCDSSSENARLKAEVEEARKGSGAGMSVMLDLNNQLVAEVERLRKYVETMDRESMSDEYDLNNQSRIINGLLRDKEHLKAEVERLNTGIQPEGSNDAVGRAVNVLLEKENEIARLKAEVERLRKAGDAMALNVYVPIQYEIYLKLISDWKAAKEGKQS